ncbi:hypothetical protein [Pedobacter nyackensis]|uniref:hypothetical protein n=1 Tax=Pedobacter nyackensis TaxID=475255 RepID=UPI00292DC8B5|nr:hypothetical protein [Pedobacter nyackensis]
MKRSKKISIIVGCIVILSNVPPFTGLLKTFVDERHYRYSTYNGSFTFYEFMSRKFEMMNDIHKSCLLSQPDLKDKQIYRVFTKNPLAFWRWGLYFFDERYKLPYKDWEGIKKIRGMEKVKGITSCYTEF